jgi:DNA invertase Pin-like site-specific DNA recombinase
MTRAFGYLRVSGKGQVDGDGFPRQLAAIKAYAVEHDIKLVLVFHEEGVNGSIESMDRPAWAEMMTALYSNGVKTVLIERLDRLARDLMVQERVIADFHKNGFVLISAAEPDLMASDSTRILVRQMMGAIAQYDKANIVAKLRGARLRKKAKTGTCEGAKQFGFYEGEFAVLERMKALRAEGLGFDRIASKLNAEGVQPRRGARWHGCAVNGILSREERGLNRKRAIPE